MIDIKRIRNFILGPGDNNGIGMGYIFSICGLAFPIVALWNSRAVVPFIAIVTLSAIILIWKRGLLVSLLKIDDWLLIGICLLLAATVHGAFHVIDTKEAFVSSLKVFANTSLAILLFFAATFVTRKEAMASARCVAIGTYLVGTFLLCDVLTNGALSFFFINMTYTWNYKYFWFKSASTTFAICTLIAVFYHILEKRYFHAALLIAAAIFIQINIGNRTAAGGLVIAFACGIGYHWIGHLRQKILAIIIILLFLIPIYILSAGFSAEKISQFINVRNSATSSVVYRMHAWEFVLQRINERPIIGWGLDGSKEFGGETAAIISDPIMGPLGEPVPLHPHNGVLEIWLELGAFGALAILLLLLRGAKILDARCQNATTRICTFSILTLLACFFSFSYSAFSSAWLANIIFVISITYPLASLGSMQNRNQTHSSD